MAKPVVFEITVLGWEKHNKRVKRGYEYFMVSNRFFDDHKIATLTSLERLLYLAILARCADERGATTRPTRDQLLTMIGQRRYDIATALNHLQENQLVSYQKKSPLIQVNSNKENTSKVNVPLKGDEKDQNLAEPENFEPRVKSTKPKKQASIDALPVEAPKGQIFVGHYCALWKKRYGVNPVLRPQDGKNLKSLGDNNSTERVLGLLEAYFEMPDPFFLKRRHDIATFLGNLNSIAHFMESGRVVTNTELRNLDTFISNQNTLKALEEGQI